MSKLEYDKLRELAIKANSPSMSGITLNEYGFQDAKELTALDKVATPAVILELLDENERLRRCAAEVIKYHQSQKLDHLEAAINDLREALERK